MPASPHGYVTFIVYGSRDVRHIGGVLLPCLYLQTDAPLQRIFLLNYEQNAPLSIGLGTPDGHQVVDLSSQRPAGCWGLGACVNWLFKKVLPGPSFLLLNPDTAPHAELMRCLHEARARQGARAGIVEAQQWPYNHPKEVDPHSKETPWASGACILVDSGAFEAIGGFDERFYLYGEDVDLSWRMWLAGRSVIQEPGALCEHHTPAIDHRPDELYPEHFHIAFAHLLLSYKYFGSRGLQKALESLRARAYPPDLYRRILSRFEEIRPSVKCQDSVAMPSAIKILGFARYHRDGKR